MSRLRISPRTFRALSVVALVSVAFIIVTGAAVRLTGSGLGCSDWPACEEDSFVAPLEFHPMVEFVNRMITGLVSLAIIFSVLGSLLRVPKRRDLVWLSLGLVGGLIGQIVLGGLTVLFHLKPPFVMGHFLLSIVLLADAILLHHRAGVADQAGVAVVERPVRRLAVASYVFVCLALFSGTVVTAAGPHGGDEDVERLSWPLPDVTRAHALTVIALVVLVVATLVAARRTGASARFRTTVSVLLVALAAQAGVGYFQYFNGVPALLVGIHVTGAVVIFTVATYMIINMYAWSPEPETVADQARPTPVYART